MSAGPPIHVSLSLLHTSVILCVTSDCSFWVGVVRGSDPDILSVDVLTLDEDREVTSTRGLRRRKGGIDEAIFDRDDDFLVECVLERGSDGTREGSICGWMFLVCGGVVREG